MVGADVEEVEEGTVDKVEAQGVQDGTVEDGGGGGVQLHRQVAWPFCIVQSETLALDSVEANEKAGEEDTAAGRGETDGRR